MLDELKRYRIHIAHVKASLALWEKDYYDEATPRQAEVGKALAKIDFYLYHLDGYLEETIASSESENAS